MAAVLLKGRLARVWDLDKYGWSIPQIADIMRTTPSSVSSALSAARRQMKAAARVKKARQPRKAPVRKPPKRTTAARPPAPPVAPPAAVVPVLVAPRRMQPLAAKVVTAPKVASSSPLASVDPARFSKRQWDVVKLHLQGLSNKEVAARLGLTDTCISVHLAMARRRVGIPPKSPAWRKPKVEAPAAPALTPAPPPAVPAAAAPPPPPRAPAPPAKREMPVQAVQPPPPAAPPPPPPAPDPEPDPPEEEISFAEFFPDGVDLAPAELPPPVPVGQPPAALEEDAEDELVLPTIERTRSKITQSADGRIRAKTIAGWRLRRDEIRSGALVVYPNDVERPQSREDCASMPRPCPWVSCAHHLYLDVNPESGTIKLNFPHLEPWEMKETCSLDVADRGGVTLEEVGAALNITRERTRQLEVRGLTRIRHSSGDDLGLPEERHDGATCAD